MKDKEYLFGLVCALLLTGFICQLRPPHIIDPNNEDPPLNAPILTSPPQNASISLSNLIFTWESIPDARQYQIIFSNRESYIAYPSRIQFSAITVFNEISFEDERIKQRFQNDSTYFWRVRSFQPEGEWSEIWSFTIDTQPPPIPTLMEPRNEARLNINTPLFTWISNCAAYTIMVDDHTEFTSPIIQEDVFATSMYTPEIQLPQGIYYWKIQSQDEAGNLSEWSETWMFQINPFLEMIYVPAGEFTMGSDRGDPDELPIHTVYLNAFHIQKYEVTNENYVAFLNDLLSRGELQANTQTVTKDGRELMDLDHFACWIRYTDGRFQVEGDQEHWAVTAVTWYGADSYARHYGFRLPTEAEWEKAARGTDARKYPWGNAEPTPAHCNFDNHVGQPTIVGRYSPAGDSPYGCCDMSGNAYEYCNDWYDRAYYSDIGANHNPRGPLSGTYRVIRGGSWYQWSWDIRSANRPRSTPNATYDYYGCGFRCVKDL